MNHVANILRFSLFTALLYACLAPSAYAQNERPAAKKQSLRYPRLCAGLKVGASKDADARRLYGAGYFAANEDHLGGRYFVDPEQQVTLHVEIGVDRIVDAVEYQRGVHLPDKLSARLLRQAKSARLSSAKWVQGGVTLGTTSRAVLNKYGRPKKDMRAGQERTLVYATDYTVTKEVLFYAVTFRFHKERLVSVRLEDGE